MKRRSFLFHSAAGVAGITLAPGFLSSCSEGNDPLHDFGLITNVVRDSMEKDHRGTMESLAKMGYKYLEFGGTYGEKPAELKAFMDDIGLRPLAGGTNIQGLLGDGLRQQIEASLEMDKKYLICYWPWTDSGNEPTWDKVNYAVDECNRVAKVCREEGIRFAYHNHDHEFMKLDGREIYDFILENTSADVCMQIDLYWAYKGGADTGAYFKRYPGRFELVHVKDSFDSPERDSFACVGDGIIDFPELFSYRDVAGFKHLIVENDEPPEDELGCALSSIQHLQSLDF